MCFRRVVLQFAPLPDRYLVVVGKIPKSHVVYRLDGYLGCRVHIRSRFCRTRPQSRDSGRVRVAPRPKIAKTPFLRILLPRAQWAFWRENQPSSRAPSRFPPKWSEEKKDFAGISHGVRVVGLRKKKKKKKKFWSECSHAMPLVADTWLPCPLP